MANQRLPLIGDPFVCAPGQAHLWTYLGRDAQAYRCANCGGHITKHRLGKETTLAPAQPPSLGDVLRELEVKANA